VTRAHTRLFEGLDALALEDVYSSMEPRHFPAHAILCREGDRGDRLFVIERGLAQVIVGESDNPRPVARLRRGDVIGEMSLIAGEPRSATVVASVATDTLVLTRDIFAGLLARYPVILTNLNRILASRLTRQNRRQVERFRGEVVALVTGQSSAPFVLDAITAAKAASPRSVVAIDLTGAVPIRDVELEQPTVEETLAALDDVLSAHGTLIVVAGLDQRNLPALLEHMDRVIAVTTEAETKGSANILRPMADRVTLVLPTLERSCAPATLEGLRVIRTLDVRDPSRDIAWLGRHLSRTKLGLALGAGGVKGFAHVGVLQVLERYGYTVDYVAGSSIGAVVGAWLGLGMNAAEIEATMRRSFDAEYWSAVFKLSLSGLSGGLDVHTRICRETTGDRSFADLRIPLVAMAVDLNNRQPAPLQDGPLWQALLASTALAGVFPPYQQGPQRLVDGLALVPVPTGAVIDAGADVTVSVNVMSRDTLPAWPGQPAPPKPPPARGSVMLNTLLEVMDLAQLDASVRHADLADVVITPRFGPGTWRDIHLADLFLEAGRTAAEEKLPALRTLASPE